MAIIYNGIKLPDLGTRAWQKLVVIGCTKAPEARTAKEAAAIAFEMAMAERDAADAQANDNPFIREMKEQGK